MDRKEKKIMRRRIVRSYVSSVISISLVLFLVGFFALLALNARSVSDYFKHNMKISVILCDDVADSVAAGLGRKISGMPQVRAVEIISREQGTQELKDMLGESFLDVFESSPVPVSIDVRLKAECFSTDSVRRFESLLMDEGSVDEVIYTESVIDAINRNMRRMGFVLTAFVALLTFISLVLINNTVRLNIFSRRFSIHTMKLVGATKGFIMKPFIRNAVYQGLLSGAVAMSALVAVHFFVKGQMSSAYFLIDAATVAMIAGGLLLLGVLICLVCSYFVVNRMVSMSVNELYY